MNIRTILARIPPVVTTYHYFRYLKKARQIRGIVKRNLPLNLIIGAGSTSYKGWISTDKRIIDLLDIHTWENLIPRNYVSHMLAEHVWEHLTEDQGLLALDTCLKFLKIGGTLRIAVPDGYHSSKYYRDYCKPGGFGEGSWDHKVFFNYISMSELFSHFSEYIEFEFLEYYDEEGRLHKKPIDKKYGIIHRTVENKRKLPDCDEFYSSLITDIKLLKKR
ncbi:MAG: hypothetical protein ACFFCQ_10045 [Promethearchaeota archaeon]